VVSTALIVVLLYILVLFTVFFVFVIKVCCFCWVGLFFYLVVKCKILYR
jgi:hypothetical protein